MNACPDMEHLVDFANMFLVSNGLFFAALGAAETDNDKLKSGLSIAGFIVSAFWLLCTVDLDFLNENFGVKEAILTYYMPWAFIVGWLVSGGIHLQNWFKNWHDKKTSCQP